MALSNASTFAGKYLNFFILYQTKVSILPEVDGLACIKRVC